MRTPAWVLGLLLLACEDPVAPLQGDTPDGAPPASPDAAADDLLPPPDPDPEEPLPDLTPLGAWVAVASPGWGMHFLAPADLRLQAAALDPSSPSHSMPRRIEFFLDGRAAGVAARDAARPGLYVAWARAVPAGRHLLRAVATNEDGSRTMSQPVLVVVDERREGARPVRTLREDLVLSGGESLTLEGTPSQPLLLVGGGRRIRSAAGWSGSLTLRHVEVHGLGTADAPAIDVTAAGAVTLEDVRLDASGQVRVRVTGGAAVTVRRCEFRANALVPVLDQPQISAPAFYTSGESSGAKRFQGNRVGLSWAAFERTAGWLIGGDRDEDVNMAWGVRAGLHVLASSDMIVRGNYSHDTCGPGLSQCLNFEMVGSRGLLLEHNVVRASAWPVRGGAGEVRYNLILDSGHSWLQAPASGARVHHNVFAQVSGPARYAPEQGVYVYGAQDVELYNNTFDGGGAPIAWAGNVLSVASDGFVGSLRSNAFLRFAPPSGSPPIVGGVYLERLPTPGPGRLGYADYNLFYAPGNPKKVAYAITVRGRRLGDSGFGAHDQGLGGEGVDPRLAQAAPLPFPIKQGALWAGRLGLSTVLGTYRGYYTPGPGSPLLGRGDPADGRGNNIGAVGGPATADRFGRFGM